MQRNRTSYQDKILRPTIAFRQGDERYLEGREGGLGDYWIDPEKKEASCLQHASFFCVVISELLPVPALRKCVPATARNSSGAMI